ncbi:MAG: hypothetical protein ACOYJB_01520 [Christensenellaceae bacterium]|jgi:DNA-binding CsgD family transcriptional regulator
MMSDKNANILSFLITGSLFFLWQFSATLMSHYYLAFCGLPDLEVQVSIVFYAAGAGGILAGGFLGDKMISFSSRRKRFGVFALIAGILNILRYAAPNSSIFIIFTACSSFLGFSIISVLALDLLRKLFYSRRPLLLALSIALPALALLPALSYAFFAPAEYAAQLFMVIASAAMFLLFYFLFFQSWTRAAFSIKPDSSIPLSQPEFPGLVRKGAMCLFSGAALYGVVSALSSSLMETDILLSSSLEFRVFMPLVSALLCLLLGHRLSAFVSILLLIPAAVLLVLPPAAISGPVFTLVQNVGVYLFLIPMLSVFVDMTRYARYPGVVCAFGLLSVCIFNIVGAIDFSVSSTIARYVLFAVCVAGLVFAVYSLRSFFVTLNGYYIYHSKWEWDDAKKEFTDIALQEAAFMEGFGLSRLQAHTLMLYLKGQNESEISENLFLPALLVKIELKTIRKKAAVQNDSDLLTAAGSVISEYEALRAENVQGIEQ